jgi:hypothetical protein
VIGYDAAGNPVLTVSLKDKNETWVTGPRGGSRLASCPSSGGPPDFPRFAMADRDGVWIGAPDGIYFYGSGGFRRVVATSQPAYPVNRCL